MAVSEAEHGLLEAKCGILGNRKVAIGALVFCLWASATSWRSALRGIRVSHHEFSYFGHHFSPDPVFIFGLAYSILVSAGVAFNSPLRADRFVFGAAAFSFSLSAIRRFAVLSASALWAIRAADAIAWTIAAAICVSFLAGWTKQDEQPVTLD